MDNMDNLIKKRARSSNFSTSEVRFLMDLVTKHRAVIENKKTDAVTNKDKEAAWNKITSMFNASTGFTCRNVKTLKLKYESLKKETKKKMTVHRQELYRTGGGPSTAPDFNDVEEKILSICSNITGIDARNDSDNIPELQPKRLLESFIINENDPEVKQCNANNKLNTFHDILFLPPDIHTSDEEVCIVQDFVNIVEQDDTQDDKVVSTDENYNCANHTQQSMNTSKILEETGNQKDLNWASWNPKSLKRKMTPVLQPDLKMTKLGVTKKIDQLSSARLQLVELQTKIAQKEHEFTKEEHNMKMLHLQNDEKRKQEIHEIMLRKLM